MGEPVSTRFLVSAITFMVSALTLMKGFEILVSAGLSISWVIKFAICLAFFVPAGYVLNKYNYFQDKVQHQRLLNLQLSFGQVLISLATLIFLVLLRIALFGTK